MSIFTPSCLVVSLSCACVSMHAWSGAPDEWQLERLLAPTEQQQVRDLQGNVFIYDGLTDRVVHRAMDEQFERIHAMMFTGVVVTDNEGEPLHDPETGAVATEDDGCD